jgi:formate dehydrogenase subunit delta
MSATEARLVMMANQIARAFARLPREEAVRNTADHIKSFWERRMLAQIFAHMESGAGDLDDIAHAALIALREGAVA